MSDMSGIKPFLCDQIDKSLTRGEWQKWIRSLELYLAAEEVTDFVKKRNKLLHLGGTQLQEVAYNLPGAIETFDREKNNDVFTTLVTKLTEYFSPVQNSTFERHVFRNLKPDTTETFNKFLLRVRHQAAKCTFGTTAQEASEINIKDKLIDSWAPLDLKQKLLEKERTLSEIVELCQVHEHINIQSKAMTESLAEASPTSSGTINQITAQGQGTTTARCTRCDRRGHLANSRDCPARKANCNKCNLVGHYERCCRTRSTKRSAPSTFSNKTDNRNKRFKRGVRLITANNNESGTDSDETNKPTRNLECFKVNTEDDHNQNDQNRRDDLIECHIGTVPLTLLIDSGSKVNIINNADWNTLFHNKAVVWNIDKEPTNTLTAYASKNNLVIKQRFQTTVNVPGGPEIITSFYVVNGGDVSLLGKDTAKQLGVLKLGLDAINHIKTTEVFPKVENVVVKLTIDPNVKPVQQPVRRIPISVEQKVSEKLAEALQKDIIEKVTEPSAWISPIVITFKQDGDVRICIDMRRANEAILRENYPLPTFDSLMAKLRNAKYFSRLDLASAYHQLELAEESRHITTFITHQGMYRYKRLMFGVNSAPEIFQRVFENLLSPCKNCLNYLDDIIVYGTSEREHDTCLEKVLKALRDNNVLLNKNKCITKVQSLDFLGHRLSHEGIDADRIKVQTIRDFRPPVNKEEMRSFLGMVTYLGKFIADLGTISEPLRQLTQKDAKFIWTPTHQYHFEKLKAQLAKLPTLAYFDPKRRTRLVADASPVALGAVLLQFDDSDQPKVISFASKSLSKTKRRYSQTEKESLALVWGVERFYFYLAGLEFELVTDHKPLEAIFKPTSKPPARIERWVLRLQSFKYKIVFQSGKLNIADSLSRLCKLDEHENSYDKESDCHINTIVEKSTPKAMSLSQIVKESREDEEIVEAHNKIKSAGWKTADKNPYSLFKSELTTMGPILLRGNKIVIPQSLRQQVLELAHEGHPGESAMKRRLRAKVWWPLIDRQTERFVKSCKECLLVSQPNVPPPMKRHKFPEGPWEAVAMDLMGPLPNKETILVVIDYYSRYQELKFLRTTTSTAIIKQLMEIFSRLGIPKSITADNGPQFASQEFQEFCKHHNIELIHTPPYWPQANGEVENMNRSILKRLKISYANKENHQEELQKFTLMHNVTPHGSTGKSPSELLFKRSIRDKIPSLADVLTEEADEEAKDRDTINKQKGKEKEDRRRGAKEDDLMLGDRVVVLNFATPHKLTSRFNKEEFWVIKREGNELTLLSREGKTFKRHVHHVKKIPDVNTEDTDPLHQSEDITPIHEDDTATATEPSTSQEEPIQRTSKVPPLKLKKIEGMWRPSEYTDKSEKH